MKTIKIITILLILSVALCVNAKKKPEYHRAEIKVSYNYHYHALRHDGEAVTNDHDYLLLANSDYSNIIIITMNISTRLIRLHRGGSYMIILLL